MQALHAYRARGFQTLVRIQILWKFERSLFDRDVPERDAA